MSSCVLAYSGGLDTSVLLGWLQDEGYDVHAVYVELGQPSEDREAILQKARDNGAKSARLVDAREELCREYAFPVLQWQAKYEGIYLLGTSIARPLISKVCLQVAREVGAVAYAHGATGKGNDQCRFQLAAEALDPKVKIIAPWRIEEFRQKFPGRTEMIDYCDEKKIPVKASIEKPYSSDENCLHISYEAGKLEDPAACGLAIVDFSMGVSPQEAPDEVEEVTISFQSGVPVAVNGAAKTPLEMVEGMNTIAGRNGVGRIDIVENRFVGMKSRGVYEAPGMTALYAAHLALEQLTLDEPITTVKVVATQTALLQTSQQQLFTADQTSVCSNDPRQLASLIDRLSNRLGRHAVLTPRLLPDAVPEHACHLQPLWGARSSSNRAVGKRKYLGTFRPLWLEQQPIRIQVIALASDGPPIHFFLGSSKYIVVQSWGPERIETGWWRRTGKVRRDYYRTETTTGQQFWLFRRRDDGAWFLHGQFD